MKKLLPFLLMAFAINAGAQNPALLKDVFPGNNSGTIQQIVKTSNYVFFNEDDDDPDTDPSLFRTDGTTAGTIKLNLTYPGYTSTKATLLTALGNKVVFAGDNFAPNYGEIWVSDGTQAGTIALERFQSTVTSGRGPVYELAEMNGYVYYTVVASNNKLQLRRTDGTPAGTSLVYEFSVYTGIAPEGFLMKAINGMLYFLLYDRYGAGNDAIWRSDGTGAGTILLRDLGTEYFGMGYFMSAGSSVCFMTGRFSDMTSTLFVTDGTVAGTVPMYQFNSAYNTNLYPSYANIGSTLYFTASNGSANGKELWKTDGTAAGTMLAADIIPGSGSSNPVFLTALNNTLYFNAFTPANGGELWKFDGSVASLVKDINPGSNASGSAGLTVSGNTIIFAANNGTNGGELWITDGTAANTIMVADINPSGNSIPNTFTPGNPVYFAASNGTNGFEVFKYDNDGNVLAGPYKFYVNDNSLAGDVFTLAAGNNNNNGSKAFPFATISYAVTKVQEGDTIYVDAGTYTEQVTLDKGLVIIGAGMNATSILKPAVTVAPPGSFTEQGVIQTAQSITGDVHLRNLSVTGDNSVGVTPVILQTGGSIKDCKLQSGNQGVFIRIDHTINPASKTVLLENNIIQAEYIGVNYAGINLQGFLVNNAITVSNPGFSSGAFVGQDFGSLSQFTATGNSFNNYVYTGISLNSNTSTINNNSFTGNGFAIQRSAGTNTPNATCNWYGSADQNIVVPKISGAVTYSPWLISGTDNSTDPGFQPVPGTCTGRQTRFYVNDNSQTGDIFTTAVGNNSNTGLPSAPLSTISVALGRAQAGDTIFVDAGTYAISNLTINKSITILGTNYTISPNSAADKTKYNTGRNIESRITGGTLIMGADWIFINGLRFTSNTAISMNADYSHIKLDKNYFDLATTASTISLQGISTAPVAAFDFSITDNRFERMDNLAGNAVFLGAVKSLWIDNNVFIESGPSVNRSTSIRTSTTLLTENLVISNNLLKKLNQAIAPTILKNATITLNRFDSCSQGIVYIPGNMVSDNVTVSSNQFYNLRQTRSVLVRAGSNGGINNLNILDNIIDQSVNGTGGIVSMIQLEFTAANNFGTATVTGNKITISGDYTQTNIGSNCGIQLTGKHANTTIANNEITFTAVNHGSPLVPGVLPPVPSGIYIQTDGGTGNGIIPANAVITITNNKIHGFKESVVFYDPVNGVTPAIGFGYLTPGVVANINNNSFTGDSVSIDNGTSSQTVNATCNWHGSAAAQNVMTKVTTSTVNYSPWLNNGTDNDPAIGFQPVPGSCNGTAVSVALTQSTNINCFRQNTGAIDITVSGGVTPYIFAWTKQGDANYASATEDISGLTAGTYHLAFTDALGSTAALDVTLTEPAAVLSISLDGNNVNCFGNNNGSIVANVSGGTSPYNYQWSNGAITSSISGLAPGAYTVVVNDANGCNVSTGYNVTQPALLSVSMSGTVASCNGSATATPAGGTTPYTYAWSNGATTQTISNVPAGTYTVTVTDAHACTVTGSYTITGNSPINPAATVVNAGCFGTSTGSITVTGAGGVAPRTYNINGSPWQSSNVFSNLPAGTYVVGVKDANGCSDFVTKTVMQPPLLTIVLDNTVRPCGSSNNGRIFITVNGGTGTKTYSWTGPNGYTSNVQDPNNLYAGTYNLSVTDAKGCIATLAVDLNAYPQISVTEVVTNVACRGDLNGAIDATVSGGSGLGFTYRWTLPGGFFVFAEDLTGLAAGSYTLLVTDNDNGCTVTKTVVVTQPAANLGLTATRTNVNGCISMGTITATASGGTAPYQYSLDGTNYQSSGLFVNIAGGTYTVYAKDANGCIAIKQTTVNDTGTDQYEANNTKNQAKAINIGNHIAARIALATDPADWFKFTTTGAGNYILSLTHPSVAYVFNMYAAGNNTPALVPINTTATSKEYVLAANTTYYISVTSAVLSFTCYDLSVDLPTSFTSTGNGGELKTELSAKTIPVPEMLSSKAYPNPHQGNFTLQINSPASGMAVIQLLTAEGKLVSVTNRMLAKGNGNTVIFNNIHDAVLFYRVIVGDKTVTGKLVRQN